MAGLRQLIFNPGAGDPSMIFKPMEKTKIAVIGAGTMGANIALSFAVHGFEVRLCDVSEAQLEKARASLRKHAAMMRSHGITTKAEAEVLAKVAFGTDIEQSVDGVNLVLEAVRESLQLKLQVFTKLDRLCAPDVILASTTSTLMPSELAVGLINAHRKSRFLVMHYWNPAHLIPLVEVVPHRETQQEVLDFATTLLERCEMLPIQLRKEVPGFIGNRLAFALQREAMSLVSKGVAAPEDIDKVVKSSFGRRMPLTGIFGTADLGGLDVYLAICRLLFPDLCNDAKPNEQLARLVEQGKLGVKTGEGWKTYSPKQADDLYESLTVELIHRARQDNLVRSDHAGTSTTCQCLAKSPT